MRWLCWWFDTLPAVRREGYDGQPRHTGGIVSENEFDLSPEEEADLEVAIAEADAGMLIPVEEVLRRMRENDGGEA